jgi:hypothetical protein
MRQLFFLTMTIAVLSAAAQERLHIDDKGKALKNFYLRLNVENLWISGQHVDWESGEPDKPEAEQDIHTHCSAFVAAACKRLNVYILRPPEHKTMLLANAQYEWLSSPEGQQNGWRAVAGANIYEEAQRYANSGHLVIATFKNADPKIPGHIALVTPAAITMDKIAESGPMLIMAGTHNFNYISLKSGFRNHITEWPEQSILFYYNSNLPRLQ